MHIDDAHDDNLVADETALHAHTRAQTRTADAAKALDDPIILTTSSDDQTSDDQTFSLNKIVNSSIDEIAPPPPRAKIAPPLPRAFATTTDEITPPLPRAKITPPPPRAFATTTDELALYDDLAIHNEFAIARAFLRHSFEFVHLLI